MKVVVAYVDVSGVEPTKYEEAIKRFKELTNIEKLVDTTVVFIPTRAGTSYLEVMEL